MQLTQKDEKLEILLVGLYLLGVIFLCSSWAAALCLVGAGVMGWRWKKRRSLSIREGVLLALFLLTALVMIVISIVQMAPTRYFGEMCDNLFTDPQQYRAINRENIDVTEEFVERYREDYEKGGQGKLREAFYEELSSIVWTEKTQHKEQGKIYIDYRLHVYFLDYLQAPEKRWYEQTYQIKGFLVKEEKTGEIVDYDSPQFSPEEFYGQGGLEGMLYGISLGAEPTTDKMELSIDSRISLLLNRSKLPKMLQMMRSYELTIRI